MRAICFFCKKLTKGSQIIFMPDSRGSGQLIIICRACFELKGGAIEHKP